MPTYSVNAINVGSFNLGESDKIITLFSAERGLIKAVAKGARKPGAKIGGRAELLSVNRLLIASGRSLDIITQAESVERFKNLRTDLTRLSYALYYAELTCHMGQGVNEESQLFFDLLVNSLRQLSSLENNPAYLCLVFQLSLLQMLGLMPELDTCVMCRKRLVEYDLSIFHHDLGGAVCDLCFSNHSNNERERRQRARLAEASLGKIVQKGDNADQQISSSFTFLTPLVWKKLILVCNHLGTANSSSIRGLGQTELIEKTIVAARHLLETYIEHRSGRKMNALSLI